MISGMVFLGLVFFSIHFLQDATADLVQYENNYQKVIKEVKRQQRLEDYEVLVHSGQVYLGVVPSKTNEAALRFSEAEFSRALKLFPDGLAAKEGLAEVTKQLWMRFGEESTKEKNSNFASQ